MDEEVERVQKFVSAYSVLMSHHSLILCHWSLAYEHTPSFIAFDLV